MYCIAREARGFRIACLIRRDITPDGYIIGSFTELAGSEIAPMRGGKVWFFKIKAE